jgi:type II secretion system protein N
VKERLRKYAPWVLYPLFYLACLCVFAVITFPYDVLKERIVTSFNAQQRATNGTQELSIDDMGWHFLFGTKLHGIRLLSASSDPSKPFSEIKIDEATVNVSLLSAIIGNTSVRFNLDAFGGSIRGSYDVSGKGKDVDLTLEAVDLAQIPVIADLVGLPTEGKVAGTISISLPDGKASKGTGAIALDLTDVAVGDGKAKLKGQLPLPRLVVGDVKVSAEAKDGQIKISKLSATGKDLELQGDGRIQMRELSTESLLDVNVRFKINDSYRGKNDTTKVLFGTPGGKDTPLFELGYPPAKTAKRADGFYAWSLHGPLGKPDIVPAAGISNALPTGPTLPNFGKPSGASVPGAAVRPAP